MEKMTFDEYRQYVQSIQPDGRGCPVQAVLSFFSGKWDLRVLFELTKEDSLRFGSLKKKINGITNTMLSVTLKGLEEKGLLVRTQFNEIPPHVEYALSEKGRQLYPIFLAIMEWAETYIPEDACSD